MEKEIFKTIPGFKDYQVSNLGNVKSLKFNKEKILKGGIEGRGYRHVTLYIKGYQYQKRISYLVLLTFISSCPKGMEVSHLDGNSLNDQLINLKWETRLKNHYRRKGENSGIAKLKNENIIKIRELLKRNYTQKIIANIFNVSITTISRIKRNKTWSHV